MTICSDSQAAIKALSALRIDSGLVLECVPQGNLDLGYNERGVACTQRQKLSPVLSNYSLSDGISIFIFWQKINVIIDLNVIFQLNEMKIPGSKALYDIKLRVIQKSVNAIVKPIKHNERINILITSGKLFQPGLRPI